MATPRVGGRGIDAALLLVRIAGGGLLLPHGLGKLFGWMGGPGLDGFAAELAGFGLPSTAPLPLLLALLQTLGGLAVLLGVGTRIAAVLTTGFIAVTAWIALGHGWFWMHGGVEYPAMWLLCLLALAFAGGGRWSIDGLRRRAGGAV